MKRDYKFWKVYLLLRQNRFSNAEKLLLELLPEDPNNTNGLALLAEIYFQQDKYVKADKVINNAISLAPKDPDLHYIKARIALQQDEMKEAEEFTMQAIKLNPQVAEYFGFLASIQLIRKEYSQALVTANKALQIDAKDLLAINVRSTTLTKLKRNIEAFETIEGALKEDPNNAHTHANYGWLLLEKGDHKKALKHFNEALKSNPSFEYAHSGFLEAMKARNPFYKILLKYSFWIGNLSAKYQWVVLILIFLIFNFFNSLIQNNKAFQPYLTPFVIGLSIVIFFTWIITPISNMFLRFNKYGQLLLNEEEKKSSNFVALSLGLSLLGAVLYFALKDERFLSIAVFGFTMMLPLGSMFSQGSGNATLRIYTISLAVVGALAIGVTFLTGVLVNLFSLIFILGFIGFQWVANYFSIKNSNY